MTVATLERIQVGDALPDHVCGPVTRTMLALFAGGSGDHNPMHIDSDFAKRFGRDDVFAHGMLSMAFLAQLLTRWVPQARVVSWNVRFVSITPVLATIICSGEVVEILADERRARVAIKARVKDGAETIVGEALVALD